MYIKCAICGCEAEKTGRNQKYCPTCAEKKGRETQHIWRERHGVIRERHCLKCGAIVGARRWLCDECLKEKRRTYQREYHQRIRAEERIRLAPIREARKAEKAQRIARLQEEKAQRAALRAQKRASAVGA